MVPLLLVLKVALVAFVVAGALALISRAMPKTPLPEWAYRDDEGDDDHHNDPMNRDLQPAQEHAAPLRDKSGDQ